MWPVCCQPKVNVCGKHINSVTMELWFISHILIHTYTYMYILTYSHIYIHTHILIHTHARSQIIHHTLTHLPWWFFNCLYSFLFDHFFFFALSQVNDITDRSNNGLCWLTGFLRNDGINVSLRDSKNFDFAEAVYNVSVHIWSGHVSNGSQDATP